MKRKLIVALLVMGLAVLAISSVEAGYYTCTISQVGATPTNYWITVSDTASPPVFTNNTFLWDNSLTNAKAMIAAAMTAWANASNVQVWLDTPTTNYSLAFAVMAIK